MNEEDVKLWGNAGEKVSEAENEEGSFYVASEIALGFGNTCASSLASASTTSRPAYSIWTTDYCTSAPITELHGPNAFSSYYYS